MGLCDAVLTRQIRHLRPSLAGLQLRLIHAGRLLTDGILLLPWLRSLEERVRRQAAGVGGDVGEVLREVGLTDEGADKPRPPEKVYLHCNVGGPQAAGESTPSDAAEEAPAPRRRGFDALLDAGLSPEEVAQMRRQFYESRGEEVPDGLDAGDVNDEHARALEEQWIEGDLTPATATSESAWAAALGVANSPSVHGRHVHVHTARPPHRLPGAPHTVVLLPGPAPAKLLRRRGGGNRAAAEGGGGPAGGGRAPRPRACRSDGARGAARRLGAPVDRHDGQRKPRHTEPFGSDRAHAAAQHVGDGYRVCACIFVPACGSRGRLVRRVWQAHAGECGEPDSANYPQIGVILGTIINVLTGVARFVLTPG